MADPNAHNTDQTATPNFELLRHGVIREDNWSEYFDKGFQFLYNFDGNIAAPGFALMQDIYGTEHIYTGDAYDDEAQRPLHHKPGTGVYADPDGLVIAAEERRRLKELRRQDEQRQMRSEGGPNNN